LIQAAAGRVPQFGAIEIVTGHGDDEYMTRCRELAAAMDVPVRWRPWSTKEHLLQRLLSADLLVTPSRFEPLGLIAAESLALGTPVIGSSVGGLKDLLSACGQPIISMGPSEAKFADQLGDGIIEALDNPPAVPPDPLHCWPPERTMAELKEALCGEEGAR
jgi:glycogen synthase